MSPVYWLSYSNNTQTNWSYNIDKSSYQHIQ